jgi:hypothetical protein
MEERFFVSESGVSKFCFPFSRRTVFDSPFRVIFMKAPHLRDDDSRFSGRLRHYHRANTQPGRSWDDWVDGGKSGGVVRKISWLRGIGIAAAVIALLAVLAGLFIEMS